MQAQAEAWPLLRAAMSAGISKFDATGFYKQEYQHSLVPYPNPCRIYGNIDATQSKKVSLWWRGWVQLMPRDTAHSQENQEFRA